MSSQTNRVFISWSGNRSLLVATALRGWLKMMVQSIDPWFSGKDIPPGHRWSMLLGEELQSSTFGIVCVTPENVNSPWLLFEAGAISRSLAEGRVVPLLLGLTQSELKGPLSQFQAVQATKDGIKRLVEALHAMTSSGVSSEEQQTLFNALWPQFESQLTSLAATDEEGEASDDGISTDLLRGILDEIRGLRVAPDEQSILSALNTLAAQAQGEILYLEDRRKQLVEDGFGISVGASILGAKDRVKRIKSATRSLQRGEGLAMKAAAIQIVGLADLRTAVRLLIEDLEQREYLFELHGDASSPGYLKLQEDMIRLDKIEKLLEELGIPLPPTDES